MLGYDAIIKRFIILNMHENMFANQLRNFLSFRWRQCARRHIALCKTELTTIYVCFLADSKSFFSIQRWPTAVSQAFIQTLYNTLKVTLKSFNTLHDVQVEFWETGLGFLPIKVLDDFCPEMLWFGHRDVLTIAQESSKVYVLFELHISCLLLFSIQ